MESSTLAGLLIEPLPQACPAKKFIHTLRDVFSWCDSWIDHNLNMPPRPDSPFAALDRIRLRLDEIAPTRHDAPLLARGCAPLVSYFRLWADHNTRVLTTVPPSRLLVVRTHEITAQLDEIARWAGVPASMLRADRARLFEAPTKHRVLGTLDPAYVRDTAEEYCGSLMRSYFPEARAS
jgi:hypothetical protein